MFWVDGTVRFGVARTAVEVIIVVVGVHTRDIHRVGEVI